MNPARPIPPNRRRAGFIEPNIHRPCIIRVKQERHLDSTARGDANRVLRSTPVEVVAEDCTVGLNRGDLPPFSVAIA